jgi:hypothetical protein
MHSNEQHQIMLLWKGNDKILRNVRGEVTNA